jgi:alanyl-tRNA synthetase
MRLLTHALCSLALRVTVLHPTVRLPLARHGFASIYRFASSSFSSFASRPAVAMDLARCQVDPYLRTLTTRVVDCKPAKSSASTDGEKKKKSREEKKEAEQSYDVELEDTMSAAAAAHHQHSPLSHTSTQPRLTSSLPLRFHLSVVSLYPEGGGQPTDHGELESSRILSVQKTSSGRIVHSSPSAFTPGSEVTVRLDWTRRFDHMQQHTGQHLLSACLLSILAAPTGSWWLASHPSECYVDLETEALPSSAQLQEVQDRCNELIRVAPAAA